MSHKIWGVLAALALVFGLSTMANAAPLTSLSAVFPDSTVGDTATVATADTISFTTATADTICQIRIAFPDGFDFVDPDTAAASTGIGAPDTVYACQSSGGDTLFYDVASPVNIPAGTTITLRLKGIVNDTTAGETTLQVATYDTTGGLKQIDGFTPVDVTLLARSAVKLAIKQQPSASDTVGSTLTTPLAIEAQDQYGNVDSTFTGSVTLSAWLAANTSIAGNGTITNGTVAAVKGKATFTDMIYDKAESVKFKGSASGLTDSPLSEAVTYIAAGPHYISLASSKSSLVVGDNATITATVTDLYRNAVADSDSVALTSQGIGHFGSATGPSDTTIVTSGGTGRCSIKYYAPLHYTGTVTIKGWAWNKSSNPAGQTDTTSISLTVEPSTAAGIDVTPSSVTIVVRDTTTVVAELLDAYGNHVDATSADQVTYSPTTTTPADSAGYWAGPATLNATTKKIERKWVGSTIKETETVTVSYGVYSDQCQITTRGAAPATVLLEAAGDSTVNVSSDSSSGINLTATVKDQYGNLTNGKVVTFTVTTGSGKIVASDTTGTPDEGKAYSTFYPSPKITVLPVVITATSEGVSDDVPITLKPEVTPAKLTLTPAMDTTHVAGTSVDLLAELFDDNDNQKDLELGDLTVNVIQGNGTATKSRVAAAGISADSTVQVTYTSLPDSGETAKIEVVAFGLKDTSTVKTISVLELDHFTLTDITPASADSQAVVEGDSILVQIEAQDAANHRFYAYQNQGLVLSYSGTGATVTWGGAHVTDNGDGTATIKDSTFVSGRDTVWIKNTTAESAIITATEVGGKTGTMPVTFVPGALAEFGVVVPDTVTAGTPFTVTVKPLDQYENLITANSYWIEFSSNKTGVSLPSGKQKITGAVGYQCTASEPTSGLKITVNKIDVDSLVPYGISSAITVVAAPVPPALAISSVTASADTVTVGEPFTVTVTLSDTTWAGKVNLSANKVSVTLPGFVLATDGVATAEVVANEAMGGLKILAEADGATGCSAEITVEAAPVPVVDAPDTLIVTDVPGDNGGWVQVTFPVSASDLEGGGYILYREVPVAGDTTGATTWEIWATCPDVAEDNVVVTLSTAPYYTDVTNWGVRAVKAPYFSSLTQGITPKLSVADGQVSVMTYGIGGAVDNIAPAAPAELRAVDNPGDTGGAVLLTWTLSSDDTRLESGTAHGRPYKIYAVTGYEIYRDGELIATVDRGVSTYVDATAENNVTYTYLVKAVDGTFTVPSEANVAIAVDNTLLADFSSNLKVWTEDFAMFVNNFGLGEADVEFDPVFDLDGNGKVWTEDFTIFVGQFGQTAGAAKAIAASAEGLNTGASAALDISREGAAITVDVSAEGLSELASYGLKVSFDPEAVQFLGASEGNLLRNNSLFVAIPTKAGEVWVLNGQPEAVSASSGLLSQLHFKALNEQAVGSAIRVDALDLFDSDARLNSIAAQGLEVTVAPERFALLQNYPNPGNPSTVISYTLAENSKVNLTIYNTLGQAVRTLVDGHQTANIYKVVWDGRDDSGKEVASGVYFYRLVAGKFSATKRLIVLK